MTTKITLHFLFKSLFWLKVKMKILKFTKLTHPQIVLNIFSGNRFSLTDFDIIYFCYGCGNIATQALKVALLATKQIKGLYGLVVV